MVPSPLSMLNEQTNDEREGGTGLFGMFSTFWEVFRRASMELCMQFHEIYMHALEISELDFVRLEAELYPSSSTPSYF